MIAAHPGRDVTNNFRWVTFTLDARRFALPLDAVMRVVRAVQITPLPLSHPVIAGAIDIAGVILPVFDLRRLFGLPERPLRAADQFIVAHSPRRDLVLVVDHTDGLVEGLDAPVDPRSVSPELRHLRGILARPDGMVLIQDLESLLTPDEERELDAALRSHAG